MKNIAVVESANIIEISEEEKELIMKARAEKARKETINEYANEIKKLVRNIEILGGTITICGPNAIYVSTN